MSSRTILRWENGDGEPNATDLIALARFFGISIDQLVSELVPTEFRALPKVADLAGPILDYWVAKVEGMSVEMTADGPVLYEPGYGQRPVPKFSSDLSLATSLMHKTGMQLQTLAAGGSFEGMPRPVTGWVARASACAIACWGVSIPEAAMRAYLTSKIGTHVLE